MSGLRGISKMRSCKTNVKLIIACHKKDLDIYRKKYPKIIFTGLLSHNQVISLLEKASIGLLPYNNTMRFTRSPRKSQEYLASGLPIICSNVNTGRESFLVENENIILYDFNNPKDLASKVDYMISNVSNLLT